MRFLLHRKHPGLRLPTRCLSPFCPEGCKKRIDYMNFKVLRALTTGLGDEYVAIDHGPEEQRYGNLGVETAAKVSPLLSAFDHVGEGRAGRLDNPRPPHGAHGPVA